MSEQPKPEWRGWVKDGRPIFAVGYLNLTEEITRKKIEKVLSSVPNTHVWLRFSATRPEKEYYQRMIGILGKTVTILPIKIFGKVFPKTPEVEIELETKKKV